MKISERSLRIGASLFLALLMVSASYLFSGPNFLTSRFANAGSTDELLKEYAAKDTDADGLPDWQEALYGTDPNKAISNSFGIPDGQAASEGKLTPNTLASQLPSSEQGTTTTADLLADVPGIDPAPGSITEQFSQEYLQEYFAASNGSPLDADNQKALVDSLMKKFTARAAQTFVSSYSAVSVRTDASISTATYADSVENIFRNNDVAEGAGEPLVLMDNLINKNDETARPKLKTLTASYSSISKQLLATPVPPRLVAQHLALIRGFDELSKATTAVTQYEKDPLGVMGALSLYQPSSNSVIESLKAVATVILSTGEPAAGAPGAMIVSIARSTETQP